MSPTKHTLSSSLSDDKDDFFWNDDEYNIMKKPGHRQLGPCWDQPVVEPLSQWCISGSKLLEIYLVYLSWWKEHLGVDTLDHRITDSY